MNLKIADAVRRLRKERKISQEELANALGVTAQAVSKWERNEGYPDITLMPKIAHFFDVSLEEVYGLREMNENNEICDYCHRTMFANYEDGVKIAREALEKYPHSYRLKDNLAFALTGCLGRWTPPPEIWEEVIALYEDILAHCGDPELLNRARKQLCQAYGYTGEVEKAMQIAGDLPDINESREMVMSTFLKGSRKIEHIQWTMGRLLMSYRHLLCRLTKEDWYSEEEKITLYRKMLAIFELHAEEGEWNVGLSLSDRLYEDIAECYLRKGEPDKAIDTLKKAAENAVREDSVDPETQKRSLLRNHPEVAIYNENIGKKYLRRNLTKSRFDPLRDTPELQAILDSLTEK